MAIDVIKSTVSDYKENKEKLKMDKESLQKEIEKADSLVVSSDVLDQEVANTIRNVRYSFHLEEQEIEQKKDELKRTKDDLHRKIVEEQSKLESVQKKIARLAGKKYTGGTDKVSQKCDALLAELDEMLSDIDEDTKEYAPNSKITIDGQAYRTDDCGDIHMRKEADGEYHVLPNHAYTVNGYSYQTDEQGRIVHVSGQLKVKDGNRDSLNSKVADMEPGDQRGHIIGDLFGGSNRNDNLVAQLGSVNQGAYKSLELKLQSLCEDNHIVYCEYTILYDNNTKRPACITVTYSIDGGIPIDQDFVNYRSDE